MLSSPNEIKPLLPLELLATPKNEGRAVTLFSSSCQSAELVPSGLLWEEDYTYY